MFDLPEQAIKKILTFSANQTDLKILALLSIPSIKQIPISDLK